MSASCYNDAQWMWLYERLCEGYQLKQLAAFCGMSADGVRYNLSKKTPFVKTKPKKPSEVLPMLGLRCRKEEFAAIPDPCAPVEGRRARYHY